MNEIDAIVDKLNEFQSSDYILVAILGVALYALSIFQASNKENNKPKRQAHFAAATAGFALIILSSVFAFIQTVSDWVEPISLVIILALVTTWGAKEYKAHEGNLNLQAVKLQLNRGQMFVARVLLEAESDRVMSMEDIYTQSRSMIPFPSQLIDQVLGVAKEEGDREVRELIHAIRPSREQFAVNLLAEVTAKNLDLRVFDVSEPTESNELEPAQIADWPGDKRYIQLRTDIDES